MDGGTTRPAMKPTTFLTNFPALNTTLNKVCPGTHEHGQLIGYAKFNKDRRTRLAQKYPAALRRAIAEGVKRQKQWDAQGLNLVAIVNKRERRELNIVERNEPSEGKHGLQDIPHEEDCDEDLESASDGVNGRELDANEVRAARELDTRFYKTLGTCVEVPIRDCLPITGGPPIKVRWIDHDTGEQERGNYSSRLVGKQFRIGKNDDVVAATPPLECMRMVLSDAVTGPDPSCVLLADVSRAYMYAPTNEQLFVEIVPEARTADNEHMCWQVGEKHVWYQTSSRGLATAFDQPIGVPWFEQRSRITMLMP